MLPTASTSAPVQREIDAAAPVMPSPRPTIHDLFGRVQHKVSGAEPDTPVIQESAQRGIATASSRLPYAAQAAEPTNGDLPVWPGMPVQAKMAAAELGAVPPEASRATARLPEAVRARMERSFATDFSTVGVARDDAAVTAMGARAYARGEQLHFAPGDYEPGTRHGDELIGHELAHVIQQREGRAAEGQAKGGVVVDAALEREADDLGARAARGEVVRSSTCLRTASRGSPAQLRMEQEDLSRNKQVYALVPGTRYFKIAKVLQLGDEETAAVEVRFEQGSGDFWVSLDDLYPLDTDELEEYTGLDGLKDTGKRFVRKATSGRVMSDSFNTLGVVSGATSLLGQSTEQSALYVVGSIGGFGVALGGVVQLTRAITGCGKSTGDRLLEGATGLLNLLSGTLGGISGILGLDGHATANTWTGVASLFVWNTVEALNILRNGKQALADLQNCELTYNAASVLCSCFKLLGGAGMAVAGVLQSQPLLIAAMVVAGIGSVTSIVVGVIKLVKMAIHHFTHNGPVSIDLPESDDATSEESDDDNAAQPRASSSHSKSDKAARQRASRSDSESESAAQEGAPSARSSDSESDTVARPPASSSDNAARRPASRSDSDDAARRRAERSESESDNAAQGAPSARSSDSESDTVARPPVSRSQSESDNAAQRRAPSARSSDSESQQPTAAPALGIVAEPSGEQNLHVPAIGEELTTTTDELKQQGHPELASRAMLTPCDFMFDVLGVTWSVTSRSKLPGQAYNYRVVIKRHPGLQHACREGSD